MSLTQVRKEKIRMFPKANEWFRKEMDQNKELKYWMVAHKISIDRSTLSHWLRFELPEDKKREILHAIGELKSEMEHQGY